jgi:adenylate cyclase
MLTGNTDKKISLIGMLAALTILLAVLEFGVLGMLENEEKRLGDVFTRMHAGKLTADPDIIIIDIDEYSLGKMAPEVGRYPWPRAIHAELLEGILAQQPTAVVFDILFSAADNALLRESDEYFASVLATTDNVYFPFNLQPQDNSSEVILGEYGEALGFEATANADPGATLEAELPFAAVLQTGRLGANNFYPDTDQVGRHYRLFHERSGWKIPSLPLRLANDLGYTTPTQQDLLLHWRGGADAHQQIALYDLYDDVGKREPQRPADELRDKIVIIGSTAASLYDQQFTPISGFHPGVEILATAIDNLKNHRWMHRLPQWSGLLITLLLVVAVYWSYRRSGNPLRILAGMLGLSAILLFTAYFGVGQYWYIPVLVPLVFAWLYYGAAALAVYLQERRTRQRSVAMFSRFLDPHVVKDLVNAGEEALSDYVNAGERELSVLFSDIRGFTTLSENRSAEEIVSLLNNYFSRQTHVIFSHGGTMDKFIGDAIMAFWGAPLNNPAHACDAVESALDMVDSLLAFRHEIGGETGRNFDIGIGIHTGPAVVGMIGSDNRLDYTCIGDTVNLASRIEGKTKEVGARILVSAATREACGDAFDFVAHGSYKVKGREQAVQLFEPRRRGA